MIKRFVLWERKYTKIPRIHLLKAPGLTTADRVYWAALQGPPTRKLPRTPSPAVRWAAVIIEYPSFFLITRSTGKLPFDDFEHFLICQSLSR